MATKKSASVKLKGSSTKAKAVPTDPIKEITKISEELIEDLGLQGEISVEERAEEEGVAYYVKVVGDDLGVLIGYHGETLNAVQLILSLLTSKKLGQFTRIILDAGDWRDRRAETLSSMATSAAERALTTGEAVELPQMSSADRRLVHIALAENAAVETVSEGEEGFRHVVVRPRK